MKIPEKWLLLAGALLLLCAAAGVYAVLQKHEQYRNVRAMAAEASAELQRMKARLAEPVPPPDVAAMGRAVPADWQLPYVIADVTLALERHRLTLQSLSVGDPSSGETPAAVEMSVPDEPPTAPEQSVTDGMPTEGDGGLAGESKYYGPHPPSSLPGIRGLPLILDVAGPVHGVLAFIDELQQWPRLVWITGLELLAEQPDSPPELRIYFNVYAGAPWDGAETAPPWPISVQPAGNGKAFGSY